MKSALSDGRGLLKKKNKSKLLGITMGLILDGTLVIKKAMPGYFCCGKCSIRK